MRMEEEKDENVEIPNDQVLAQNSKSIRNKNG